MNIPDLIAKAKVLHEALPYIQDFRGSTFVVKYGGSFMASPDPAVRQGVARDIVFLEAVEINPVVVHGGGKAITRAMETAGLKPDFVHGQRVTDAAAVQVVDQVLSREINPEIVATINSLGGMARAIEEVRSGKQVADAATRHRLARSRRGAREASLLNALEDMPKAAPERPPEPAHADQGRRPAIDQEAPGPRLHVK